MPMMVPNTQQLGVVVANLSPCVCDSQHEGIRRCMFEGNYLLVGTEEDECQQRKRGDRLGDALCVLLISGLCGRHR